MQEEDVIMRGVEERYAKEGDKVYLYWRHPGTKRWFKRLTPLTEIPYVEHKEKETD